MEKNFGNQIIFPTNWVNVMATLPYVTAAGNIRKALDGIISAATPERVTQDFVKTILKIPGGSGDQMTSYLKKIGFAGSDGTPTELYRQFRNQGTRGLAAVAALKRAYEPLYRRNEYMHELPEAKLKGLIIEETGAEEGSSSVTCIMSAIKALKAFADFSKIDSAVSPPSVVIQSESHHREVNNSETPGGAKNPASGLGLNLSYTINLNLPATSDIAVFNAIFKSLKDNLLRGGDE